MKDGRKGEWMNEGWKKGGVDEWRMQGRECGWMKDGRKGMWMNEEWKKGRVDERKVKKEDSVEKWSE